MPDPASDPTLLATGVFLGVLLGTALLNLVAWIQSRHALYGWFGLFVACSALRWASMDGLTGLFLPFGPAALAHLGDALLGAQMVTGSICQIHFLQLRAHHPLLLRYYQWGGIAPGLLAILAAGSSQFDTVSQLVFLLLLPAPLLSAPAYLRLWRGGHASERLVALALPLHFLFMLPATLGHLGLLPFMPVYAQAARLACLPVILVLHARITLQMREAERARDAAQQQTAEALARSSHERQERQNQEHLLAMIAHEVRTPVAVIAAASHSLRLLERIDGDPALREGRYRNIEHAVQRMQALMDLTQAQARLGDDAPQTLSLDLAAISRQALDDLDPETTRRLTIDADTDLPTTAGDARLLYFALLNLMDNALKYSDPGTPIRVHIAPTPATGGLTWSIRDHGRGIPRGQEEAIFAKYRRLDETSGQPGLGLGLPLARQIAERHGGHLRLDRDWRHGAGFHLWLPCAG